MSITEQYLTDKFITTKISIPEHIKIGQNVLILNAIVVYLHRHYTCYFRQGHIWYYYDDLDNSTIKIGNYYDLLDATPSILRNCTLVFYC